MIIELQEVVFDQRVRGMCRLAYPNHPKGCPNFKHKNGCPPDCPPFSLDPPWFAIVNEFDFAVHVERMRGLHPVWSKRQLECCLYWQPRARKDLSVEIKRFLQEHPGLIIDRCPEAGGVNVTDTLKRVGIVLEWPPVNIARQVVFGGTPSLRPLA